jgi:hypothetical protein
MIARKPNHTNDNFITGRSIRRKLVTNGRTKKDLGMRTIGLSQGGSDESPPYQPGGQGQEH